MMDIPTLQRFATDAQSQIGAGVSEDVLRAFLISQLELIFPDSPWWVKAHAIGSEALLRFSDAGGQLHRGYADTIVGKTAIEYEKNLLQKAIFDEGYYQVKEYCAGLCNLNHAIKHTDVFGVLSDTVRWYGYSIEVREGANSPLGPDDITLVERDKIDLSRPTVSECGRFERFIDKYLARPNARFLKPETLACDFGVNSDLFAKIKPKMQSVISMAETIKPDYFQLIQNIWHSFVEQSGVSNPGDFRETYVDEFYLVTLAKILCVDILKGASVVSTPAEAVTILDGSYFLSMNLGNLVDYDYFGWLNEGSSANQLATVVIAIQGALTAYDFTIIEKQDLFGTLLAELATAKRRLLLGQERTPSWLARAMVKNVFQRLPENTPPHMLDMCSGAGVFLIEGLNEVRDLYHISSENYSKEKDDLVFSAVMGFDIDPLAVMLAKVNWVLSMRDLFPYHSGPITIPIYHADSLFLSTPISRTMPKTGDSKYELQFDGISVLLPAFLLSAAKGDLFDCVITKAYRLAMARARTSCGSLSSGDITTLLDGVKKETVYNFSHQEETLLHEFFSRVIPILEDLQRRGRNGIWSFVLSNSYRPGLLSRQFNCIVSNPPWLALSHLSNNPYKESLTERANRLGINPPQSSFLHLELATTFLLSSVSRYLEDGSPWGCILPDSVISGQNHLNLRNESYRTAEESVQMKVEEIWEIPSTTFSAKGCVLFGSKSTERNPSTINGMHFVDPTTSTPCSWQLVSFQNRTAWVRTDVMCSTPSHTQVPRFIQGADLMPRIALFHHFKVQPNGSWSILPIRPNGPEHYLISGAHADCSFGKKLQASDFDPRCVFKCLLSSHVSPFYVSEPASAILPFFFENGTWLPLTDTMVASMNSSSQYVWRGIAKAVCDSDSISPLTEKIDFRRKLSDQCFDPTQWLVVYCAGGKTACAASLRLQDVNRVVVDQTLYWHLANSEEEARYLSGLINSQALANAIAPFQPRGNFKERHIHALVRDMIPIFDSSNPSHCLVVKSTQILCHEWEQTLLTDPTLNTLLLPDSSSLAYRRRTLQAAMRKLSSYQAYEDSCQRALTPSGDKVVLPIPTTP